MPDIIWSCNMTEGLTQPYAPNYIVLCPYGLIYCGIMIGIGIVGFIYMFNDWFIYNKPEGAEK